MSLSILEIRRLRQESWRRQTKMVPYEVHRPLSGPMTKEPYTFVGGTYKGNDIVSTISKKIEEKNPQKVAYCDAGCGAGDALIEAAEHWCAAIVCIGITSYPYHAVYPENSGQLAHHHIQVQQKDLHIPHYRSQFDVISAIHVLNYVFDPIAVLEHLYTALKPGGVAFVSPFAPHFETEQEAKLTLSYLEKNYDFEQTAQGGVAFSKTSSGLSVPTTITGFGGESPIFGTFQATYSFGG